MAGVQREILTHLLELALQFPGCALVAAVLAGSQLFALLCAAHDRPHEQVTYVGRHRLRQRIELGRIRADRGLVAIRCQWQNVEDLDTL